MPKYLPNRYPTNILFVSTYQTIGGAARATWRLFQSMRHQIEDCHYSCLYQEDYDSCVGGIIPHSARTWFAQQFAKREARAFNSYPNAKTADFSPYFSNLFRVPITKFAANLLHLHWITKGLVVPKELLTMQTPVIWTLHDTWAFTGGCHYTADCDKYKKTCGSCPQLGSSNPKDISFKLMQHKQKIYTSLDMTIVTPSQWLANIAKESSLFKDRKIEVVPNGLDTNIFKPINKQVAKEYFSLDLNNPVLLFGGQSITDHRKGGDLLKQALSGIQKPFTLLTFGDGNIGAVPANCTIKNIGSLREDSSLALVFSAADIFVCPSREDNLPNTIAEALACGTPCVAFEIGGIPEMIIHKKTGWLAKANDSLDLAAGIQWIINNPDKTQMNTHARDFALKMYNIEITSKKYIALYQQILVRNAQ